MPQTDYLAPTSADQAVAALAQAGPAARVLSGGTDLLVQLRAGRLAAGLIIDLKRIPEAVGIRREGGGFIIGAATSGAMLGEHLALCEAWPGVVEAAKLIGSTQIQGRASLAGNLCNASPAADSVPALVAANATCVVVGPGGRREVPVQSIPVAPGQTSLGAGEFVLEIRLPRRPAPLRRRLSALDPAHRDGHRRRRRRGEPHPRRGRRDHLRPRCAGRGRPHRDPVRGRRRTPSSARPWTRPRSTGWTPPRATPAVRSATSAAPSNSAPASPASSPGAWRRSPMRERP